jgi:hypothetical protein
MSEFKIDGPILSDDPVRLTDATATAVFTATGRTAIASIICTPTSGTPTCTIEIFNAAGTGIMKLRTAQATTAGTPLIFNEVISLSPGQVIKVTSSAAGGDMDVMVTRGVATAAAELRG